MDRILNGKVRFLKKLFTTLSRLCYNSIVVNSRYKGGVNMYSISDIADWFISKEPMTNKKLQKLCYYAQAWHCALHNGKPLVNDRFEAWVHGPVCPNLYHQYKDYGWEEISKPSRKVDKIGFTKEEIDFLESVWMTYGDMSGHELESLTHTEPPWKKQRRGLEPWQLSNAEINQRDMAKYYLSIYEDGQND